MLDFKPNADYHEQEQRITDNLNQTPCIICGRGVKEPWKYTVHLYMGATLVTSEEAQTIDPAGDLGGWPIGANCLKKHPEIIPYLITGENHG
jgi:hypothetical protein